ncbi:MAG: hypothetical protein IJT94_13360 [Oscillibacter sp.]|nr:hypothetical protein [Oscillibacter sp.]
MIELTSGFTRIDNRVLRPSDGPFSADPDAEKRLVSAGVARYVYPADELTARVIREAEMNGAPDAEPGTPQIDAETPLPAEEESAPGVTLHSEEIGAESEEDASSGQTRGTLYDADHLNGLTNAHLKEIADDMGLNTSAMRKKADYVEAILAAQDSEGGEDDGDNPPDLGAKDPVE